MQSIIKELTLVTILILFYFIFYFDQSLTNEIIFISFCLLLHIEVLIRTSKSSALLLLSIFATTYPIYILIATILDVKYHVYIQYQTMYYTTLVFFIQTISLRIMFFRLEGNHYLQGKLSDIIQRKNNPYIFILLLLLISAMLFLSIHDKKNFVISGGYSIESASSIFFEYCIPVLICLWLYSKKSSANIITVIFFFIFILLPLFFGRRLPFTMVSLLFFNLYLFNYFSRSKTLLLTSAVFIFLSLLAVTRIGGESSIIEAILAINSNGIMENNQGGVVISAATYLGLIDDGYFDFEFGINSLLGMLTSPFLTSDLTPPETYINFEALRHASIPGNGGFPGVYFYIWLGWPGVIIMSILLNRVIFCFGKNQLLTILVIFILSTFPRWYAYNMIILFKMTFWLIMLFIILNTIHHRIIKYRK